MQSESTASPPTTLSNALAAVAYAKRFCWRVLPLHDVTSGACSCGDAECRSAGKHPRLSAWQCEATNDPAKVAELWARFPNAGIGIATGKTSGFFCLDVDGAQGRESLAALVAEHGELPATVQALTGSGGDHYLFKMPEGAAISNSAGRLGRGLDIRGDNGQIVVAPSVSLKGKYRWVRSPLHHAIADAPAWLIDLLRPRAATATPPAERGFFPDAGPDVLEEARDALQRLGSAVEGEGGDAHTFRACALLRHDFALTYEEAWPLLVEWNATCLPPWSEGDLAAKLRGGDEYGSGAYGSKRTQDILQRVRADLRTWREDGRNTDALAPLAQRLREMADGVDPVVKALIETEWQAETGQGPKTLALPRAARPSSLRPALPHSGPDLDVSPSTGAPIANHHNVVKVLEHETRDIYFDEFTHKIINGATGREWTDADDLALTLNLQRTYGLSRVPPHVVHDGVVAYAHVHKRDPVRDWLTGLKWDGVDRIAAFFAVAFGAVDSLYTRSGSANFWKGIAARALKPGCKLDEMVVLEGEQGTFKSTALRAIVTAAYFAEASESPHSKDFFLALVGRLIVEIGEMDSFSRAEVAAVKRVLSCQVDRYRPPYGRTVQDHPRRGIFVGTVNRSDWARDDTGGRRFWPIKCSKVDLAYILANRDQLFAEAVARVNAGEKWHEMPADATRAEQEARRQVDPWEEILGPALATISEVSIAEIFDRYLIMDASRRDRAAQMRVGSALKRLGFEKVDGWRDGRKQKWWRRSEGGDGGKATTP